jgi:hypothetical protein
MKAELETNMESVVFISALCITDSTSILRAVYTLFTVEEIIVVGRSVCGLLFAGTAG